MFKIFCSDIMQTMKCFALENSNWSCQVEHTKTNSRLNFNPALLLIGFWTSYPWVLKSNLSCFDNKDLIKKFKHLTNKQFIYSKTKIYKLVLWLHYQQLAVAIRGQLKHNGI